MKALVPVDGSDAALAALDKLSMTLHLFRHKPQLVLINVQLAFPHPRAIALVGNEVIAQYYEVQSDEALAEAEKRLEQRGQPFEIAKRVGDPAQEIVHFAESEQCEIIAMGTHGRTALSNLLMGSVATKVLATSRVPVLFLR